MCGVAVDEAVALAAARQLIADEACWCRSAPARWRRPAARRRAETWEPTNALDYRAERWCAAGALCKVTGRRTGAPGIGLLEDAAPRLLGTDLGRANDRHGGTEKRCNASRGANERQAPRA